MKTKIAIRFVSSRFTPVIRRVYPGAWRGEARGKILFGTSEQGMPRLKPVNARYERNKWPASRHNALRTGTLVG
jgi:hypothetical protein